MMQQSQSSVVLQFNHVGYIGDNNTKPWRSKGLLTAELDDHGVVFNPSTLNMHLLNWTASLVLQQCDGVTPLNQIVDTVAKEADAPLALVRRQTEASLSAFEQAGLLEGERVPTCADCAILPSLPGRHQSMAFAIPDGALGFRSDDAALIGLIDDALDCMLTDKKPTMWCGLAWENGRIRTAGPRISETFASPQDLLKDLSPILGRFAMSTTTVLVLHAGAVVTDAGLLILPGASGAGKSTLTGALLRSGAQYLSDDAVGIQPDTWRACAFPKPLSLSARSREALDLGTTQDDHVDPRQLAPHQSRPLREADGDRLGIVLPTYAEGIEPRMTEPVAPLEALRLLAPHATNLAFAGQRAFETLISLAREAPTQQLFHGDAVEAAWHLS